MDPVTVPLHAFHEAPPDLPVRLLVNAIAGLAATVVMNIPMNALPEGTAPPFVAASVLSDDPPFETDPQLANGVHYVAGTAGGVLFTLLALGFEVGVGVGPNVVDVPFTPLPLVPHLLAGLLTYAFLLGFFGYLVLPRFGPDDNHDRIRYDWTLSAAVYAGTLLILVPVFTFIFV